VAGESTATLRGGDFDPATNSTFANVRAFPLKRESWDMNPPVFPVKFKKYQLKGRRFQYGFTVVIS